VLSRG
jgi:hypothetical protein